MTLNDFEEKEAQVIYNTDFSSLAEVHRINCVRRAAEKYGKHKYNEGIEAAIMGLGFSSKSFHYPSQFTEIAEWIRRAKLPEQGGALPNN